MKFNIFTAILLILGLNIKIIASGTGGTTGGGNSGTGSCSGDFVSSEFSKN